MEGQVLFLRRCYNARPQREQVDYIYMLHVASLDKKDYAILRC